MESRINILGLQISSISFNEALEQVKSLGSAHVPSYVCFANVHMTIEAHQDKEFCRQVNQATLVLADGNPLTKASGLLYKRKQERISGMDFMPRLFCSMNNDLSRQYKVFFYGATQEVLNTLQDVIKEEYLNVKVVGAISPPFRPLTDSEQEQYIDEINKSQAHIVFVSLGCPKQEKWMHINHKKINAILLGVGGAFLTTAGLQKRSPVWMQKLSLEWLYRLLQEPKRLFKRYFITNSLFIYMLTKKLIKKTVYGRA